MAILEGSKTRVTSLAGAGLPFCAGGALRNDRLDAEIESNSYRCATAKNVAGTGRNNRWRSDPNVEENENSPSISWLCCQNNSRKIIPARSVARHNLARRKKHASCAIEGERTSPSPGLNGSCPVCGSAVLAKCGTQRVHHWAHWGKLVCDRWWEAETEWHRNWKDKFPLSRQEVIRFDISGEKHIADVHTDLGLTNEFQHSRLNPRERAAREKFHANMIWVVNGARLAGDLPRFIEGRSSFMPIWRKGVYVTPVPTKYLQETGSIALSLSSSISRMHMVVPRRQCT